MTHTPGPWTCFYKRKYDEWHVGLPLPGQGVHIGLFSGGCQTENPEADARLIAAAPQLLDALQAVSLAPLYAMLDTATKNAVSAAIAKATGATRSE